MKLHFFYQVYQRRSNRQRKVQAALLWTAFGTFSVYAGQFNEITNIKGKPETDTGTEFLILNIKEETQEQAETRNMNGLICSRCDQIEEANAGRDFGDCGR